MDKCKNPHQLFIIFFNDLNDCLRFCDIYQYADNTVILFAASNVNEIEFAINDDLKRIGSYCLTNQHKRSCGTKAEALCIR